MKRLITYFVAATLFAPLACVASGCSSDESSNAGNPDSGGRHYDAANPPPDHRSVKPDSAVKKPDAVAPGSPDGGGDASTPVFIVGERCTKDADCAAGLTCLKPSDNIAPTVGGPAGGLCTKECTPSSNDAGPVRASQSLCAALDQASLCVELDPTTRKAYCFRQCFPGAAPQSLKCGGRTDVACSALAPGLGYCAPTCATDSECPGRVCNFGTGYCEDKGTVGAPFGTPCGTGSALEKSGGKCAGFCLSIDKPGSATPLSECSGQCLLGELGCGTATPASGAAVPGPGLCSLADPGAAAGDTGYCLQPCDCDGDCLEPDNVFSPLPSPGVPGLHKGTCKPIFFGSPLPGIPCADGGKDAGAPKDAGARDAGRG